MTSTYVNNLEPSVTRKYCQNAVCGLVNLLWNKSTHWIWKLERQVCKERNVVNIKVTREDSTNVIFKQWKSPYILQSLQCTLSFVSFKVVDLGYGETTAFQSVILVWIFHHGCNFFLNIRAKPTNPLAISEHTIDSKDQAS